MAQRAGTDETAAFYREIEGSGALPEGIDAVDAADAVLCALMMRLSKKQARDVFGSLPPPLQRLTSRCVERAGDEPLLHYDRAMFVQLIASDLRIDPEDAERLSRAVFAAVQRFVPEDEVADVESQLPQDLLVLWHPYTAAGVAPFEAGELDRGTTR